MAPFGLHTSLLLESAIVCGLCWLTVRRLLPPGGGLLLALVKVLVPLVYFAFFFDATWTHSDDWAYLNHARELLADGYGPIAVLLNSTGLERLRAVAGSWHILYDWWNIVVISLFGPYYFAPVLFNVWLTFVAGAAWFGVARLSGFSLAYSRGLLVFFLLQWDILAWSSFVNLKDVAVLAALSVWVYLWLRLRLRPTLWNLCLLAGLSCLLYWLRRPTLFLLLGAALCQSVLLLRRPILLLGLMGAAFWAYREYFGVLEQMELEGALFGSVHFFVTPRPWALSPSYGYLVLPATLHWLFLPPSLAALPDLWRRCAPAMILCLSLLVLTAIAVGSADFLWGPRHRLQVVGVFAWLQFHALWLFTNWAARTWKARGAPAASVALRQAGY